jgi:hypothetical protein
MGKHVPGDIGLDASFLQNEFRSYLMCITAFRPIDFCRSYFSNNWFLSVTRNIGKLQNKGYEFTLDATPLKFKDFTWNVSFNITHNTNTVKKLPGGKDIIDGSFILRRT